MTLKVFRLPAAFAASLFGAVAVLAFAHSPPPGTPPVRHPPQERLTFEWAVDDLAEGKDKTTVGKALEALRGAGEAAFPTLIAHLGDQREAFSWHFGAKAIECAPAVEPCPPYHPTIGEASFEILAGQLEGN